MLEIKIAPYVGVCTGMAKNRHYDVKLERCGRFETCMAPQTEPAWFIWECQQDVDQFIGVIGRTYHVSSLAASELDIRYTYGLIP